MFNEDTIAAISTPLGYSGIGIVRLSGRDAIEIADRIFISPGGKRLKQVPSHRLLYGHIINPEDRSVLDEVLVSVMKAPHTYTREDVVEINCHGGPVSLRRILELVLSAGARLAQPGEFTRRAFLNGRIDLAQAEAVLDVINSLTEESQKAAIEQLRGGLSKRLEHIRQDLIELTAIIEAFIDFPEEDIEIVWEREIKGRASKIKQELRQLMEGARYGKILREGLKTAIVGRPNVGKSSLLNALLERDRVIVTEIPGTTRDVIEEYLNIQGLPVRVMDTAGIRETRNMAEQEGVERSLRTMREADLILLVLDGSDDLHRTDMELLERAAPEKTILVINKTDLPLRISKNILPSDRPAVSISALKGTGLKELKDEIVRTALKGRTETGTALVTNIRHRGALERALQSMESFEDGMREGLSAELLAIELRESLDALGEITGATTSEEILDRIFSNFCIGK